MMIASLIEYIIFHKTCMFSWQRDDMSMTIEMPAIEASKKIENIFIF